ANEAGVAKAVERLLAAGIEVSIFIDPDPMQIDVCKAIGAKAVEIQTARYSEARTADEVEHELASLKSATTHACDRGLAVHMGHGLNYVNVLPIIRIAGVREL